VLALVSLPASLLLPLPRLSLAPLLLPPPAPPLAVGDEPAAVDDPADPADADDRRSGPRGTSWGSALTTSAAGGNVLRRRISQPGKGSSVVAGRPAASAAAS